MTISLFISILAAGSILSALLTEAIKIQYINEGKIAPPNVIALINAIVCGGGITAVAYMLMSIPWTVNNVICLICLIFFSWLGSMIGYDKITQTAGQITEIVNVKKDNSHTDNI